MDLIDLLDRPIAFHRSLAQLAGSVCAGLLLSQALYWSRRTEDPAGWFWKTQTDWENETCLTRREQESARALLRSLVHGEQPLWMEERRGVPAKMFYRVDAAVLIALLRDKLDCTIPPNQHGGNRQTRMAKTAYVLHRIHAENTAENTPFFSGNRATREPVKKAWSVQNFTYENLADLFTKETHEFVVDRCAGIDLKSASEAFLTYHRDRGTTFRSPRAIIAAWRGWMSRAGGRAGEAAKNSTVPKRGLNQAELNSLRLMGVEV